MSGLHFAVSDLVSEIGALRSIAAKFIAIGGDNVLRKAESDLINISARHAANVPWEIKEDLPLRSVVSEGDYMRGGGQRFVFAELSFVWGLTPIRESGDSRPARIVELAGLASTKIRLMEGEPEDWSSAEELAMWRIEVAVADSPGTHFHVQILGGDENPPFPKSVDVPRLPSLVVSPFASMEFAISELFQTEWAKHSSASGGAMNLWRGIQGRRMERQLEWHLKALSDSSASPWSALKAAKPPSGLFLQ